MPVAEASLPENEPVIGLVINGDAQAYPLRILIWHEIVNDVVGGVPVAITYAPLCNTALVFDRRVGDRVLEFGSTGKLRHSGLVMYDRTTESWWQQFLGKAIVGELTGTAVAMLPARLEAFATFGQRAPEGRVQVPPSDARAYGTNPYVGYDSAPAPFLYQGMLPKDLAPLARVVRVGDGPGASIWCAEGAVRGRRSALYLGQPGRGPRYRHDRRWQGRRQHPGRAQVRGRLGACRVLGRLRVRLPCFLPDGVIHVR